MVLRTPNPKFLEKFKTVLASSRLAKGLHRPFVFSALVTNRCPVLQAHGRLVVWWEKSFLWDSSKYEVLNSNQSENGYIYENLSDPESQVRWSFSPQRVQLTPLSTTRAGVGTRKIPDLVGDMGMYGLALGE